MAEADFITGLIKKGLGAAAGAAAGKVGSTAASFVLDLIGFGDDESAQIASQLTAISDAISALDAKVGALVDDVKWDTATANFDDIRTEVQTHADALRKVIDGIPDDKPARDHNVSDYLLTATPSIGGLAHQIAAIDKRMTGGVLGTIAEPPLMKTLLDTQWDVLRDDDPAKTYDNIFAVYARIAETQRMATSLLVAYYRAKAAEERAAGGNPSLKPGEDYDILATQADTDLTDRLVAQFRVMLQVVPGFLAFAALRHPRLRLDIATWMVGGVFADFGPGSHLKAGGTLHPYLTWALTRVGERSSRAIYRLELSPVHLFGLTTPLAFAHEDRHSVEVKEVPSGSWVNLPVDEDVREITLVPASGATGALAFEVRPAVSAGTFRFATADGSGLALFDRGEYGITVELTDSATALAGALVLFTSMTLAPPVEQPALAAWSRDFTTRPAGEGRFRPKFRVRYRVVAVNRFGESAKSGWVQAHDFNQDADGYFDGNGAYYFPQIRLPNESGRAESYRVYRQFAGDGEEDVTAGGTFNADPQSGDELIFDDFTP